MYVIAAGSENVLGDDPLLIYQRAGQDVVIKSRVTVDKWLARRGSSKATNSQLGAQVKALRDRLMVSSISQVFDGAQFGYQTLNTESPRAWATVKVGSKHFGSMFI